MSGGGSTYRRGGRQKGSLNKATREIKELAQPYGPAAIGRLTLLAGLVPGQPGAQSEQAQIMACRELLDRAYGKATQILAGDEERPHAIRFTWGPALPEPAPNVIEVEVEPETAETVVLSWQDGTHV
jgi:hypothetical protein